MNPEKVVFGFFIVLALTLNFGFFVGEIENPAHHNVWELFAVLVVNLIATVLTCGLWLPAWLLVTWAPGLVKARICDKCQEPLWGK